jgi:hypothetical protein
MMFNSTFSNILVISWQSVLLLEESGENHQPVTSHRQTLSHNVVSRIFIVLAHWNNSPWIDMSPHSNTIIPIPTSLCCVFSGEATNTIFIVIGLTRLGFEPTTYHTWGKHANHYTRPPMTLKTQNKLANFYIYFMIITFLSTTHH